MKKSDKIFHWLPRILCILAIAFVSLFALDAFSPELSFWQQIGAFLMHLIPSFILLALLILAWNKEFIGGILFTIIGLVLSPIVYAHNYRMNHSVLISLGIILTITVPFILVGILFIINYFRKKRKTKETSCHESN
ncbi:DUF7670 domain-containing protein [Seonamhaeicola maritimus]|uniref:DUF7670 domain-containing protein n=1 Tax=Seonamhaeicola maritimus TaxID=2591822 RepID=UPI002494A113|nr:hypothetical protein [Seonamhaeicola maritimus]